MTARVRIRVAGSYRDFIVSQFPVAVGLSDQGVIEFGDAAQSAPLAWLGVAHSHVFIEPVAGTAHLEINNRAISSSAWLSNNDRIRLGETLIEVSEVDGVMVLSPGGPRAGPTLTPPVTPPAPRQRAENQPEPRAPRDADEPLPQAAGPDSPAPTIPVQFKQAVNIEDPGETQVSDPFLATGPVSAAAGHSWHRRFLISLLVLAFLGAGFVLVATPVQVTVTPEPDAMAFTGLLPPIKVGERYLVLPGTYQLSAQKKGFRELQQSILVEFGTEPELRYSLKKLPGYLTIQTDPDTGVQMLIDGQQVSDGPLEKFELEAGAHRIRVTSDRYQPAEQDVEVAGMGRQQTLRIALNPGWGTLKIRSEPEAAELWLDGEIAGVTPTEIQPMAGNYQLELRKSGWQTLSRSLTVKANEVVELPIFILQPANGTLEVTTTPAGASVTANGIYQGQSPLTLTLAPGREHALQFSKTGFQTLTRTVRVTAAGRRRLAIRMRAEYGIVFITSRPADAQLRVDGKLLGTASRRLRLTTRAHRIEVFKAGYDSFTGTVTPTADTSKRLEVRLRREQKKQVETTATKLTTAGGQVLRKIDIDTPVQVRMGSSRGEPGRRSNESPRTVELTRTFYISEKEVTNAEFLKFKASHQSGDYVGSSLSEPGQPVVSVTWDDAARYANWLSEKENLPSVYREEDGKMIAKVPLSTGYRLPTEAEWVFVTRYADAARGTGKSVRYPWGNGWPPPEGAGNYADRSAAGQLQITLQTYTDGYRVAAPVGQFPPNTLGIYDLGGNVSEWVHDYYDAYLGSGTRIPQDPAGPLVGRHHVIKGASWKHGAMTELRLSYRDYADKPRSDVGFRVARYADKIPTK